MKLSTVKNLLNKRWVELLVFSIFLVLNASFLFMYEYIHSLDGPQHIYNATVIAELIKGNDAFSEFFKINPVIVGYWAGPFLLSLLNLIFEASVAIKLLLVICIAGVAYSFRYLVYSIQKRTSYLTLLIIPFSTHIFLMLGYYTFSLAWIFFFLTMAYYIRNSGKLGIQQIAVLMLFFTALYLSHLIVFSFTLLCLGLYVVLCYVKSALNKEKNSLKKHLIIALKLLAASLPAIILAIIYSTHVFYVNQGVSSGGLPGDELAKNLFIVRNLMTFNYEHELVLGRVVFFTLLSLVLYIVAAEIVSAVKYYRNEKKVKLFSHNSHIWFFLTLTTIAVYVFLPNGFGTGAVSNRVLVLLYFLLIVWISTQKTHALLTIAVFGVFLYVGIERHKIINSHLSFLNSDVKEIMEVASHMEPNKVYYAMNYSDYYNHTHMACYAGADNPVIYVKNPQCEGHFPVVWNKKRLPRVCLGSKPLVKAKSLSDIPDSTQLFKLADYVLVWGNYSFMWDTISSKKLVDKYYIQVAVSSKGNAALYKFRFPEMLDKGFKNMKESPKWMANLKEKASIWGIPVENVMYLDAFYMIDGYIDQY